jgi:enamine deaminase RidA (YjgF/YER057c/UK114 family)
MTARVVAGAPNEARYGFSQAVARGGAVAVAGQVGKDNRTGEMVDARDLDVQLGRAVANVRDAAGRAQADAVLALTAHVTGPLAEALPSLERALAGGPVPALTAIRVAALAHPTYLAELSATAGTRPGRTMQRLEATAATAVPWAPAATISGDDVHVSACHGHGDDPGAALAAALASLEEVLGRAGCGLADVLGEHVYVVGPVDADGFAAICDAHAAAYAGGAPASTLVLVDELVGGARVAVTATARREA